MLEIIPIQFISLLYSSKVGSLKIFVVEKQINMNTDIIIPIIKIIFANIFNLSAFVYFLLSSFTFYSNFFPHI